MEGAQEKSQIDSGRGNVCLGSGEHLPCCGNQFRGTGMTVNEQIIQCFAVAIIRFEGLV